MFKKPMPPLTKAELLPRVLHLFDTDPEVMGWIEYTRKRTWREAFVVGVMSGSLGTLVAFVLLLVLSGTFPLE